MFSSVTPSNISVCNLYQNREENRPEISQQEKSDNFSTIEQNYNSWSNCPIYELEEVKEKLKADIDQYFLYCKSDIYAPLNEIMDPEVKQAVLDALSLQLNIHTLHLKEEIGFMQYNSDYPSGNKKEATLQALEEIIKNHNINDKPLILDLHLRFFRSYVNFDAKNIRDLFDILNNENVSIKSLHLESDQFGDSGIDQLIALPGISALETLCLRETTLNCKNAHITDIGIKKLCGAFREKNLDLSDIYMYGYFTSASIPDLMLLIQNKNIKRLRLSSDSEFDSLGKIMPIFNKNYQINFLNTLKDHPSINIEHLDLRSFNFEKADIRDALIELLNCQVNIKKILLKKIRFNEPDMRPMFARVLQHNFPNSQLDLAGLEQMVMRYGFDDASSQLQEQENLILASQMG